MLKLNCGSTIDMDIMDLHSILLEFNFVAIAIKRKRRKRN
jgi:hypothetical protein